MDEDRIFTPYFSNLICDQFEHLIEMPLPQERRDAIQKLLLQWVTENFRLHLESEE